MNIDMNKRKPCPMKPVFRKSCPVRSLLVKQIFFLVIAGGLLSGCASPGPKYLNLTYFSHLPVQDRHQSLGLTRFNDIRDHTPRGKGYVGFRQLPGDNRELFVVTGQDLSASMTRVTRSFLEDKGFSVSLLPPWPATVPGVSGISTEFTHVLAADINQFECRAVKTLATTDMTLFIDLTFYLGTPDKNQLTTIPIALTLERTELIFSRKKLETFVNEAIAEILSKALPFL
jgi:hypothetical protein